MVRSSLHTEKQRKVLSLFSGAGGLDKGFEMSGKFKLSFALDNKEDAAKTYSRNRGFGILSGQTAGDGLESKFYCGDIKELQMDQLQEINPTVIIGGPPCQDFSAMRGTNEKRKGIRSDRGRLYAHFVKALLYTRPNYLVFENVPGLRHNDNGISYRTIKGDFSNPKANAAIIKELAGNGFPPPEKGYEIMFSGILDASRFGVPQKRQRLVMIGVRMDMLEAVNADLSDVKRRLALTLGGEGSIFKDFPLTSMEAIEGAALPDLEGFYSDLVREWKFKLAGERLMKWTEGGKAFTGDIMSDYIRSNGIKNYSDEMLEEVWKAHTKVLKTLGFYGRHLSPEIDFEDGSNKLGNERGPVIERMRNIPPGKNYSFVDNTQFQVRGDGISVVYRRLHPLKPSYTVLAGGGGGTHGYHYLYGRSSLTNRERARLQSFPDDFMFEGTQLQVRKQIGEAVPPLLGKILSDALDLVDRMLDCQ
ncbi:MAG: DNA cytosine methyltransferase [Candidatus Thermoplasmatota archaeon]|nr:DNA cytosine methyltransferase [Candidatus Thermoplasmatota archaeon]